MSSTAGGDSGEPDHLVDDLRGGQVAGQTGLAGRAERARHAASGLAGDAHRDSVRVAHQHALDERAVMQPPQRLASGAVIAVQLSHRGEQRRHQRLGQPRAIGRRNVGHLTRIAHQPAEVVGGDLVRPERLLPHFRRDRPPPFKIEVGEVFRRQRSLVPSTSVGLPRATAKGNVVALGRRRIGWKQGQDCHDVLSLPRARECWQARWPWPCCTTAPSAQLPTGASRVSNIKAVGAAKTTESRRSIRPP